MLWVAILTNLTGRDSAVRIQIDLPAYIGRDCLQPFLHQTNESDSLLDRLSDCQLEKVKQANPVRIQWSGNPLRHWMLDFLRRD
jgi:hypothetical protein